MITYLSSPFSSNDKKVRSQNRKDNGSFSRAAKQLAMANSAVSRVVKRLEEKLGVNLINRTTRQLRLTEEGLQYFRRVQKILQEMAAAEAEMLAVHEVPQGVL